jgi:branched-chain amino acid aminotransferase
MIDVITYPVQTTSHSRLAECDFNNLQFGKTFADHMFVADYKDGQWQQPRIVPYGNLSLSPALSSLHYGQALFEGLKAYKNEAGEILVFRPEANARRLNASAERLCMPPLPEEIFLNGLAQLLSLDRDWIPTQPGYSLYIRPVMFATDDYIGVKPSDSYSFIIFCSPVGAYYNKPVRVKVETHYTRAAPGGMGFAKAAGNYAAAMYPSQLAQEQGYDQLLWTDGREHKYFEESGTMNVIFVINGKVVTPPTTDSILKGVTRDSVLQLVRDWGVAVEERPVSVEEVIAAAKNGTLEEAFGAGTAATIAPIAVISHEGTDYTLPSVENRKISNRLRQTMDDIKTGRVADPHGWIFRV